MRGGASISVSPADRRRLAAIVADRKSAQMHVWRARIVLLTDDGVGTAAVMRATGVSKTCVWRWQERFMAEGIDGLLRDRTRPPGKTPVAQDRAAEIVRLTPPEAPHWTARVMAKTAGLAVSTVQRIWKARDLAPHCWRSFKLSKHPAFAEKRVDIVGLFVNPSAHAVVLLVYESEPANAIRPREWANQIEALDRTQPGLPMKTGRLGSMTNATARPRSSPR